MAVLPLHFKQLGRGEPLLLLHGLLGSADNWFGVAPKIAEAFHVHALDLRNHGQSPHSAAMDYPLMAADVDHFFAEQKMDSACVIGHSMGGKVAMQLALNFPTRVKKLIVVDMAPRNYQRVHDKILSALLSLDLAALAIRQQAEDTLLGEIPSLNLRRFLLKNLGRDEGGRFFWKPNLRVLADSYGHLCEPVGEGPAFGGPTLFIRGGRSEYVDAADGVEIRRRFPLAEVRTLPEAGHWVHADAPEEFVREVVSFLS